MCKNILIENCYAEGSSDAGIYVGQSDSAIVRNCKAAKNVAGCEIENTTHAEVYNNEFYDNTAGFLIFDLPGLSQKGGHVKAYKNFFHDNNHRNFARAGSFGTSWGVGNAAPGSGVIILAASHIELYDNRIINNNSSAITLASGFAVDEKAADKINDQYAPVSKTSGYITIPSKWEMLFLHLHMTIILVNCWWLLNKNCSRITTGKIKDTSHYVRWHIIKYFNGRLFS